MNIVSFSGGKDSTAMLLMMLEWGIQVDEIIFCDTGLEFPAIHKHINQVEEHIGRKITHLKAEHSFEYYMFEYIKTKGKRKGERGYGWPQITCRWCTGRLKTDIFNQYIKKYKNVNCYIGIAVDESWRCKNNNEKYPLVDWKITEAQALTYCYEHGFRWDELYTIFYRVSCWCCFQQSIGELKKLRRHFPELWQQLGEMDRRARNCFKDRWTVEQLECRFAKEDEYIKNQMSLFG